MILFMPWPVQKYITTHLYIIAEFVEAGKWGRRCLLLRFALLHTHCALIPNCFALRAPAILRGIPELLRTSLHALRVNTELLRTSCSRNSARHSHSGLSAFVFMSRHPVKCATCREQALACARLTGF